MGEILNQDIPAPTNLKLTISPGTWFALPTKVSYFTSHKTVITERNPKWVPESPEPNMSAVRTSQVPTL